MSLVARDEMAELGGVEVLADVVPVKCDRVPPSEGAEFMTHGGSHHLDLTFAERERAAVPGETPGIHKDAASENIDHGSPPDPTLIDYLKRVFGVTGVEQTPTHR